MRLTYSRESKTHKPVGLFCLIGGMMGLWAGISISIMELACWGELFPHFDSFLVCGVIGTCSA